MTVKELIEKLKEVNQDSEILTITVESNNDWNYTSEPKISESVNSFGSKVWIL